MSKADLIFDLSYILCRCFSFLFFFLPEIDGSSVFGSQNTFVTNLDKQRNLFCMSNTKKAKDDYDDDDIV